MFLSEKFHCYQLWKTQAFHFHHTGKHLSTEPVKYEKGRVELANEVAIIVVQKGECSHFHQFVAGHQFVGVRVIGTEVNDLGVKTNGSQSHQIVAVNKSEPGGRS